MNEKGNLKKFLSRTAILASALLVTGVIDTSLRTNEGGAVNPGMAFGIAIPGLVWWRVLWLVPLAYIYMSRGGWGWLLMTVGGAVNMVAGMRGGGVLDYWTIPYTQVHNNLPDWLIFAGFLMVIWTELKHGQKLK